MCVVCSVWCVVCGVWRENVHAGMRVGGEVRMGGAWGRGRVGAWDVDGVGDVWSRRGGGSVTFGWVLG